MSTDSSGELADVGDLHKLSEPALRLPSGSGSFDFDIYQSSPAWQDDEVLVASLGSELLEQAKREATEESLVQRLATVETVEGQQRLGEVLARRPFPHFEALGSAEGLFLRTDEDGTQTKGRFEGRSFVPIAE